MKPKFYALLLLAPVLFLASCKKWVAGNDYNYITGNWELVAIDRYSNYGTEPVYSEFENGAFYFSNNYQAEYSDNYGRLYGSWNLMQRSDGYYDPYGNWHNGPVNTMQLRLYDNNYDRRVIEWEFYAVEISNSRIIGYMNRYGYDYRYEFRRY